MIPKPKKLKTNLKWYVEYGFYTYRNSDTEQAPPHRSAVSLVSELCLPFSGADTHPGGALEAVEAEALVGQTAGWVLVTVVRAVRHAVTLLELRDTLPAGAALPACRHQG